MSVASRNALNGRGSTAEKARELDFDLGAGLVNYFTPVNVISGDILSGVELSSGPFRGGAFTRSAHDA